MAIYNFSYPDIPYMESREMYEYFLLLDKTIRTMGEAINTVSSIDPETIAKLVMPKADGLTIRDTDNVWSVVRAPSANIATEADHAISADSANHATLADSAANAAYASTAGSADKLTNSVTISLVDDVTGSASFDGSQNVEIETTVVNNPSGETAAHALTADKLTNPVTITIGGDMSGSASFDGSEDIIINTTWSDDIFQSLMDRVQADWVNAQYLPVANMETYDFTAPEHGYLYVRGVGSGQKGSWVGFVNKRYAPKSAMVFPTAYRKSMGCGGMAPVVKGETYTLYFYTDQLVNNTAAFLPYVGV